MLGALFEKELTTPDAYPLTLNALTTACNQTSNRDPVVHYEPREVETILLALKGKGMARIVHPGSGERATKYRQVADEALQLDPADRALLCVLLLRGAQTVAELKTRTERLHGFATAGDVEDALDAMTRREPPLVARVDRLPGAEGGAVDPAPRGRCRGGQRPPPRRRSRPPAGERAGSTTSRRRVAALEARVASLAEALGEGEGEDDRA